jgi:hypothetical protein
MSGSDQIDITGDTHQTPSKMEQRGNSSDPENSTTKLAAPQDLSIDPENEVKGAKLLIIHLCICLCTFLVGLVSLLIPLIPTSMSLHWRMPVC